MTSNPNCFSFSAFKIDKEAEYPFRPDEYSKFKYGDSIIAEKYGCILAEKFIEQVLSKTYKGTQLVVIPSAYTFIPTASYFMQYFFLERLNYFLYKHNYPIAETTKIYRSVTYREDYGQMSAEDRYKLISRDKFYIDQEFLRGKELIFIDDIKITGTHERIILNLLDNLGIQNRTYMLYFAELTNQSIDPKIENYFNNHYVKTLKEVESIISSSKFVFNTRVVKFILNSDKNTFQDFLEKQDRSFAQQLYYNAIGNEFFKFAVYQENLEFLEKRLFKESI